MKMGGRTAIHPKIPSPAPTHRKPLVFMDNHKRESPNSTVRKLRTQHRLLLSQRARFSYMCTSSSPACPATTRIGPMNARVGFIVNTLPHNKAQSLCTPHPNADGDRLWDLRFGFCVLSDELVTFLKVLLQVSV